MAIAFNFDRVLLAQVEKLLVRVEKPEKQSAAPSPEEVPVKPVGFT
jgi:hypothetical protein